MEYIDKLQEIVDRSRNIVFFGGAGVSTASGIPDFRSAEGVYSKDFHHYSPEEVVSHSFYMGHMEEFFDFYRQRLLYLDVQPNAAHRKLVELERAGKLSCVITQNVDGLHQLAGSKTVLELHGSVHRNHCQACGKQYDAAFIHASTGIPACACGGVVKPDVVLFEESLDEEVMQRAAVAISKADTLIVGGTSLVVYPAAGFVGNFSGGNLVIINKTPTDSDSIADLVIPGDIAAVLGQITI